MTSTLDAFTIHRRRIPEQVVAGHRLGRHVHHDSRSLAYRPRFEGTTQSVAWKRYIPVLDQGDLGSCTGNASIGQLGTGPLYQALTSQIADGLLLDEKQAVTVYSLATTLDSYAGTYLPDDTGSDGLSAAKACQKLGFISGYVHATTTDEMVTALQTGPGMVGTNWTTHMDSPDAQTGIIAKPGGGTVRGGHEYEVAEVDLERGLFWFWNSWGTGFALGGRFGMQIEDFAKLLADQGDATFFVPVSSPAPQPVPVTTVTKTFTADQAAALDDWAGAPHWWHKATLAAADWKAAAAQS